jgi:putative alpha-1,2-mannosidase
LYDPAVGFLRARAADGQFPGTFDALDLSDDYAEANAWHSLWMAGAHDPDGLAELLGGRDAMRAKLDTFFTEARRDWETADPSAANFPRPYYWHGNEPDLNAAFLYAQIGFPADTVTWSHWILANLYNVEPHGVAGNDDGGTLGSWYVFASLGLYPVPGTDRYILGQPRFDQARVIVDGLQHIIARRADGTTGVTVDGVPVDGPYLTHAQLTSAVRIEFP